MSHEITTNSRGQVEFAFNETHGAAWHGLGHPVPADHVHDVDYWRTNAGMDWQVKRSRVRFGEGDSQRIWDDHHVLFRSDCKSPIGLVSQGYKIVQPGEVVEFFRDLVEAGGMELSAMGTLQGGRRFWATARIGESAPVSVRDKIGGFVLLSTSADGSLATEARLTSVRVVCANTLRMARDAKPAFRLTHRSAFDADRIKSEMGINRTKWQDFQRDIIRLSNTTVRPVDAEYLTAKILSDGDEKSDVHAKARESRAFKKILSLFSGGAMGSQFDGVQGTAWGLLNAVTEYTDHHAASRTDENRFISSQWGPNADLKSAAFETLLAL